MKFRFTLGLLALVAGLVFGFSALPSQAHAATAVTLSDTDRGNLQSVLDLTKVTLDTIQLQINRNAIQNRATTLATLGNIQVYLLNMRSLLGGEPVASIPMTFEEPEPVAPRPVAIAPVASPAPIAPVAPVVATTPSGEVAGSAVVNETAPNQQTAAVSSSTTSKRAFWIILITAIVIAIILAIPRKKEVVVLQDAPQDAPHQKPQPPQPEETEPVQSA